MNRNRTIRYYRNLGGEDLCACDSCQRWRKKIRDAYPKAAHYLDSLGADIAKPHEVWAVEYDDEGTLMYMDAQYVIFGNKDEFSECAIGDIKIRLAKSYPPTGIKEEHYVMEMDPFFLKADH